MHAKTQQGEHALKVALHFEFEIGFVAEILAASGVEFRVALREPHPAFVVFEIRPLEADASGADGVKLAIAEAADDRHPLIHELFALLERHIAVLMRERTHALFPGGGELVADEAASAFFLDLVNRRLDADQGVARHANQRHAFDIEHGAFVNAPALLGVGDQDRSGTAQLFGDADGETGARLGFPGTAGAVDGGFQK